LSPLSSLYCQLWSCQVPPSKRRPSCTLLFFMLLHSVEPTSVSKSALEMQTCSCHFSAGMPNVERARFPTCRRIAETMSRYRQ
jgi:hypothetical protein